MDSLLSKTLSKIYFDASNPAAFGGVAPLLREARKKIPSLRVDLVKEWLSAQDTYTLHKPIVRKFKRNRIIAPRIGFQMEMDLADMASLSKDNSGIKYLLTIIDVFSKKAFVKPLKTKSKQEVTRALDELFNEVRPEKVRSDNGTEFVNDQVSALMKKHGIQHFTTTNEDVKCSIVERFNRTLKNRIFRFLTANLTKRYVDNLHKFVKSYNNSIHRSIKFTPNQVNESNEAEVFFNLYGTHDYGEALRSKVKQKKDLFGKSVRLAKAKTAFSRGFYPTHTEEVFKVKKAINKDLNKVYELEDLHGERIEGRFYSQEIQPVIKEQDDQFHVEKVLRKRTYKGQKQLLVRWLGWSSKFDSWISKDSLSTYQ